MGVIRVMYGISDLQFLIVKDTFNTRSEQFSHGSDMRLTRLVKLIGLVALTGGIIGFLLPGQFVYSPDLESFLSRYGDALFKGISSNPMVMTFNAKAPVIILIVIGFLMLFWGLIKELTGPEEITGTKPHDSRRSINELIESQKTEGKQDQYYKKSVKELADRKKP